MYGDGWGLSLKIETIFHYCWRVKSSFKLVWLELTSPCNSLIGRSLKWRCCFLVYFLTKTSFDPLGRDQSSFRLPALLSTPTPPPLLATSRFRYNLSKDDIGLFSRFLHGSETVHCHPSTCLVTFLEEQIKQVSVVGAIHLHRIRLL